MTDSIRFAAEDPGMYWPRDLLRELADPVRGGTPHHKRLHRRVLAILAATVCLDVAATLLMYGLHGLGGTYSWKVLGEASVWSASQLLTGGSSINASSFLGHLFEVVLELWAITVVAALAGSIAAFFQQGDAQPGQIASGAGVAGDVDG